MINFERYFKDLPNELKDGVIDSFKFLYLYLFNKYFDADKNQIYDLLSTITKGNNSLFIDAFLEDDEEETFVSINSFYIDNDYLFTVNKVKSRFATMKSAIKTLIFNNYDENTLLTKRINECTKIYDDDGNSLNPKNFTYVFRIITNITLNNKDREDFDDILRQYNDESSNYKYEIVYGEDVEEEVESNNEPFENVKDGFIEIDNSNNILNYSSNSMICNVSAFSLQNLWKKEGKKGLLAQNLRYYIKNTLIDEEISNSIKNKSDNFWYLNNGIIIVCDDYQIKNNKVILEKFSIVNGGQTTRMIGETYFEKDFYLMCKIIKKNDLSYEEGLNFVADIAKASNSQKPITAKDLIANLPSQRKLKELLKSINIFCEIKRGEKCPDRAFYKEDWQKTKNNELTQDIYAFAFGEPGPVRSEVKKILTSKEKFNKVYCRDYDPKYLKDILFIEKGFKKYRSFLAKMKKKDPQFIDNDLFGLINNGQFYFIAVMGYLLKYIYNFEFKNYLKNNNNERKIKVYESEFAFSNNFLNVEDYNDYYVKSRSIIDLIFKDLIRKIYLIEKEEKPSLVYSNFTKTNVGFNKIKEYIRRLIKINSYEINNIFDQLMTILIKPNQEMMNNNVDNFIDLVQKANKSFDEMTLNEQNISEELFNSFYHRKKDNGRGRLITDAQLDRITKEKPATEAELKLICKNLTRQEDIAKILDIISRNR